MTAALIAAGIGLLLVGLAVWRLRVTARRLDQILDETRPHTPTDPETTIQP